MRFPGDVFQKIRQKLRYGLVMKVVLDRIAMMGIQILPFYLVEERFSEEVAADFEKGFEGFEVVPLGPEGRKREEEIKEIARARGIHLVGPNSMGIFSAPSSLVCMMAMMEPLKGEISFVSQSGNIGVQMLAWGKRLKTGFRHFVSSGNEADLTAQDYIRYFGEDPDCRTVMVYLESIKGRTNFLAVAAEVARKKPVVVFKGGKTPSGLRAAASHSGALAGRRSMYDASFRQGGLIQARTTEAFIDCARSLARLPLPRGDRVGIITRGGGWGVITTDACEEMGLTIPEHAPHTFASPYPGVCDALPEAWAGCTLHHEIIDQCNLQLPSSRPSIPRPCNFEPFPLFSSPSDAVSRTGEFGTKIAPPVDFGPVRNGKVQSKVTKQNRNGTIRIAIASGKGGTGKTTVATNLVVQAAESGHRAVYGDCDVEEPNGHLFLRPDIEKTQPVSLETPSVIEERCTGCGRCGEVCVFSAIVVINKKVLTFPELCHSCGGCWLACPEEAIEQGSREIGIVETGRAQETLDFVQGRLRIGEAMAPPLIKAVKQGAPEADLQVFDAPPGTSCPVIQTVRDADYVLLVTEPTPFGLNDLRLAVEMLRELDKPLGVVINRADVGDDGVSRYCAEEEVEILLEIPDDRKVAEAYARGDIAVRVLPEYREIFQRLLEKIMDRAKGVVAAKAGIQEGSGEGSRAHPQKPRGTQ